MNDGSVSVNQYFPSLLLPLYPPDYKPRILILSSTYPGPFWCEPLSHDKSWKPVEGRLTANLHETGQGILLPDGSVLFVGGRTSDQLLDLNANFTVELFNGDPLKPIWSFLPPMTTVRQYHSVGLVLYDGRIIMMGSSKDAAQDNATPFDKKPLPGDHQTLSIEIYTPDYLWRGPRPVFSVNIKSVYPASQLLIELSAGWQTSEIGNITLLRCNSATHGTMFDQRLVVLKKENLSSTQIRCTLPPNSAILPPGFYMLFVLSKSGTPSFAEIVQVELPQ